mmetsp:Transcript_4026/g.7194  ORF Transcript_4026/g.7194 Transcript_4026/m.7194 type:complete len:124 (+) Transcript_4026:1285-1656(+)
MAGSTSFSAGMSALSMQATAALGETSQQNPTTSQAANNFATAVDPSKNNQIVNLISLLQENMPSDQSSPGNSRTTSCRFADPPSIEPYPRGRTTCGNDTCPVRILHCRWSNKIGYCIIGDSRL